MDPRVVYVRDVQLCTIVIQYAEGGDLRTHIDKAGKLSESETRCILQQIVRALRRYHEVGMAKRDLRLEHILLCDGAPGVPHIKLCDFAYSKTEQVNRCARLCGFPLITCTHCHHRHSQRPQVCIGLAGVHRPRRDHGADPQ